MFERIREMLAQDTEAQKKRVISYIVDGYGNDTDSGIRREATAHTWEQYQRGEIDRDKAIERATRRALREIDKRTAGYVAQLDAAEAAPDIYSIDISVEWHKSRTWGHNPSVKAYGSISTYGSASGCGYDKESAAVAEALNSDPAIMKILYSIKENGLRDGQTSASAETCTGHDNRTICGYGAGYSVVPYFEGGVGVNCFWNILKKAGYTVKEHHGKTSDFYDVTLTEIKNKIDLSKYKEKKKQEETARTAAA